MARQSGACDSHTKAKAPTGVRFADALTVMLGWGCLQRLVKTETLAKGTRSGGCKKKGGESTHIEVGDLTLKTGEEEG